MPRGIAESNNAIVPKRPVGRDVLDSEAISSPSRLAYSQVQRYVFLFVAIDVPRLYLENRVS